MNRAEAARDPIDRHFPPPEVTRHAFLSAVTYQRVFRTISWIFSGVWVRFAVQPDSSYFMSLTSNIEGISPGSFERSRSSRAGRRKSCERSFREHPCA